MTSETASDQICRSRSGPCRRHRRAQECEDLLRTLRNNPTVAAYHLWADRFGSTGAGRARDIDNVHRWDPTHATYSGTYKSDGIGHLAKSDFVSYYDFAWKRGPDKNFPNHAFPADFWLQPVSGEFVMGLSKYKDNPAHDVAVLANHNAYAPQEVTLKPSRPVQPAIFDRSSRTYKNLPLRNGSFSLTLEPAGAAIVIFKPR